MKRLWRQLLRKSLDLAFGKGFKVAAGVGLAVLAGVVIYKYVGKPMIAKIKAQKEQQIIDAEWEDSDEPEH